MFRYKLLSLFLISSILSYHVLSKDILILDVRTDQEWSNGYVEGATHQPVSKIDDNFQQLFPNKNQKIILYCARGGRAEQAKEILSKLGYTNLENGGGILDVSKRLNLPIVKN